MRIMWTLNDFLKEHLKPPILAESIQLPEDTKQELTEVRARHIRRYLVGLNQEICTLCLPEDRSELNNLLIDLIDFLYPQGVRFIKQTLRR